MALVVESVLVVVVLGSYNVIMVLRCRLPRTIHFVLVNGLSASLKVVRFMCSIWEVSGWFISHLTVVSRVLSAIHSGVVLFLLDIYNDLTVTFTIFFTLFRLLNFHIFSISLPSTSLDGTPCRTSILACVIII